MWCRCPAGPGGQQLSARTVSSSECETGNCSSSAALAIGLHGAASVPSDRLMPKNIATIMVPTPMAKNVWQMMP